MWYKLTEESIKEAEAKKSKPAATQSIQKSEKPIEKSEKPIEEPEVPIRKAEEPIQKPLNQASTAPDPPKKEVSCGDKVA